MMSVSHRLFAAALADSAAGRRTGSHPDRPLVIELARPEDRSAVPRPRAALPEPAGRRAWYDSRLHA